LGDLRVFKNFSKIILTSQFLFHIIIIISYAQFKAVPGDAEVEISS
jgi:hypothetical protein